MKKGQMLATMLVIATNAHNGQFDKGAILATGPDSTRAPNQL